MIFVAGTLAAGNEYPGMEGRLNGHGHVAMTSCLRDDGTEQPRFDGQGLGRSEEK